MDTTSLASHTYSIRKEESFGIAKNAGNGLVVPFPSAQFTDGVLNLLALCFAEGKQWKGRRRR